MEDEVRTILRDAAAAEPRRCRRHPAVRRTATTLRRRAPGALSRRARRVVLIIGGGIAAYKSLDLIRRLKERGACGALHPHCAPRRSSSRRCRPGALAGERASPICSTRTSEFDVGHIRLARDADLIVVAPATADLMAKMANGHADDLATAVLLATDRQS